MRALGKELAGEQLVSRTRWAPILAMVMAAGLAPAGPPGGQLLESRVDILLREWSEKTSEIQSLYTVFQRTSVDRVWNKRSVVPGSARYLAPDKARLDIFQVLPDKQQRPDEGLILTGKGEIWHYSVPKGQITIYELPPNMTKQEALEEGPLPFLFATQPEKAKQRYSFEIVEETEELVRAKITPKLQEDQQNFAVAEISLDKKTFLPKRLFFIEANQNEVTFDFFNVWTNIEIKPSDFDPPPTEGFVVIRKQINENEVSPQAALPGGARSPR